MSSSEAPPVRLTVLISGSGTNLQAVIDSISLQTLPATVVRVISNRKDAFGLERARRSNIPTLYHNLVKYKKAHPQTDEGVRAAREEYDAELARLVLQDSPQLVACLGFMHVLSKTFLEPLEREGLNIINLHPALPGQFNGAVSTLVYNPWDGCSWVTADSLDTLECDRTGPSSVAGWKD